ncbi:hypothetical protein Fot_32350 [Forsythia ovata]|uniref:Uncharacterized protein n=1 Tax=Forsythia ovata TaxID=205694 RepID=A0ABD1T801_9LAMI
MVQRHHVLHYAQQTNDPHTGQQHVGEQLSPREREQRLSRSANVFSRLGSFEASRNEAHNIKVENQHSPQYHMEEMDDNDGYIPFFDAIKALGKPSKVSMPKMQKYNRKVITLIML